MSEHCYCETCYDSLTRTAQALHTQNNALKAERDNLIEKVRELESQRR